MMLWLLYIIPSTIPCFGLEKTLYFEKMVKLKDILMFAMALIKFPLNGFKIVSKDLRLLQ